MRRVQGRLRQGRGRNRGGAQAKLVRKVRRDNSRDSGATKEEKKRCAVVKTRSFNIKSLFKSKSSRRNLGSGKKGEKPARQDDELKNGAAGDMMLKKTRLSLPSKVPASMLAGELRQRGGRDPEKGATGKGGEGGSNAKERGARLSTHISWGKRLKLVCAGPEGVGMG